MRNRVRSPLVTETREGESEMDQLKGKGKGLKEGGRG